MRRTTVARLASCAPLVLAGCSLVTDLSGFSEPVTDAGTPPDAAAPSDARPPSDDAGDDAAGDAPSCVPSVVADTKIESGLEDWLPFAYRANGYPKVEAFGGGPAAVLFPTVVVPAGAGTDGGPPDPQIYGAHSGIWRPGAVPLAAFDLDVEVFVACTTTSSCADGLVVAWIDSTTLADLTNTNDGHVAGLPASRAGAAVILDDYGNDATETTDPPPPTIQIVQLDATKSLGQYPWQAATAGLSFLGAWHRLGVRLRGGDVSATIDGAAVLSGKVRAIERGLFGLTAGTGGETDAVALRDLHAKFYACVP